MTEKKPGFSGKIGFVLTAVAACIGIGCMWSFPNQVAELGGGTYILLYILFLAAFGIPLLLLEFAIGRKTGGGTINAFRRLNAKFVFVGVMALLACLILRTLIATIGGEVMKFGFSYALGEAINQQSYQSYITGYEPVIWVTIFVLLTGIITFFGVKKGIERIAKIALPAIFFILIGMAIYVFTIPGISDGMFFLINIDFSMITPRAVLSALAQVLFTLTLGYGIMITFGSYAGKDASIVKSGVTTAAATLCVCILAVIVIVPVSYLVVDGNMAMLGADNMIVSLSTIFSSLPFGSIIGASFYLLFFLALLMVNVTGFESIVCAVQEIWNWSRKKTVALITLSVIVLSIPVSLASAGIFQNIAIANMNLMDIVDIVVGTILPLLVILMMCICIGFFCKTDEVADEILSPAKPKLRNAFVFLIRFLIPIIIIVLIVFNILSNL